MPNIHEIAHLHQNLYCAKSKKDIPIIESRAIKAKNDGNHSLGLIKSPSLKIHLLTITQNQKEIIKFTTIIPIFL